MARASIPDRVRRDVLTEAGYRCAVPTCRGILALDLHHVVPVREEGPGEASNLIALCPTCHALHERGTMPREAIETYKTLLVALTGAFDRPSIDLLLFLASTQPETEGASYTRDVVADPPRVGERHLTVSGDGLVRFAAVIASGYADYTVLAMSSARMMTYMVRLTQRGMELVNAWKSGRRGDLEAALGGNKVVTEGDGQEWTQR